MLEMMLNNSDKAMKLKKQGIAVNNYTMDKYTSI